MHVILWFFGLLFPFLVSTFPESSPNSNTIEIFVEVNTDNSEGMVHVAIYDSKSSFLKRPFYQTSFISESNQISVSAEEFPSGEFAVAAFLDTNGNGKLDTNFFGVPSEPYGFSNNVRGVLGPPQWKDARMSLSNMQTELTLVLE